MDVDFVINLIAVGAPGVGKSTLIKRYLTQQYNEEYQPTGLEQLTMSIRVGTATAKMQIWDFGGRIALDSDIGRKLLERGDIFLLCFNVADPSTFEVIKQVLDFVSPHRANAFVCIVGCKSDLRAELLAAATKNGDTGEVNKKNPNGDTDSPSGENNTNESDFPVTPRPSSDSETSVNTTESPESTLSDTTKQESTSPSTSSPPNLGVPREQATELASLNDVHYFEVSAKTNTDIQVVFHTALIHAYKKYLAKKKTPQEEEQEAREREKDTAELREILTSDSPVFFADFFPRERMRSIFLELFKTRDDDLIRYLAHKDVLPKFIEASLLDFTMPSSVDNRIYREFAVTSLDNLYKLDPIFVATAQTPSILDSLFGLFFDRQKFCDLPLPRKRYLIRFFTQLFDTQTEHIIKYAQENTIINRLAEHVESDDVKEVLSVLLGSEKKYVDRSDSVDFVLLETSNVEPFLCAQLQHNAIGIVDSFFRVLTSARGFSSPIVTSFLKYENFSLVKSTLDLVPNSPCSFDAVTFFCDVILRIISLNESLVPDFVNVVSANLNPTKTAISLFSAVSPLSTTATSTSTTSPEPTSTSTTTSPDTTSPEPTSTSTTTSPEPTSTSTTSTSPEPTSTSTTITTPEPTSTSTTSTTPEPTSTSTTTTSPEPTSTSTTSTTPEPTSTSTTATTSPEPTSTSTSSTPLTSSSLYSFPSQNCQLHVALLLVNGLVRCGIGNQEIVKPLLLDCVNAFFKVKLGNVIHCIITSILVSFFEQQFNEEIDMLVNEGQLIERILACSEDKTLHAGIYGHLMLLAKSMNTCPHLEEKLLGNEKWQQFTEISVKEYLNKSICPPDTALIAAKQRQIQRAGGSFLG